RRAPQSQPQIQYPVARQAVNDSCPIAFGFHQMRRLQRLEVLRRVGERHCRLCGERFDVTWRLGQEIDQLEPLVTRQGGPDAGELGVDAVLELAMSHRLSLPDFSQVYYCSTDRLTRLGRPAIVRRSPPRGSGADLEAQSMASFGGDRVSSVPRHGALLDRVMPRISRAVPYLGYLVITGQR